MLPSVQVLSDNAPAPDWKVVVWGIWWPVADWRFP